MRITSGASVLLAVLCSSSGASAQEAAPEPLGLRAPQFLAVSVPDIDESSKWYREVFALTDVRDMPGGDGTVRTRLLRSPELVVEMSQHAEARSLRDYAGAPTPTFLVHGFFKAGFFVANLDRSVEILRRRGVTTLSDVRSGNGLRWVLFRDNAGNFLQLLEPGK